MNITLLSTIVLIYLLAVSYLAWRGYKSTQTAADYMVAGRGIHPYIMALSYGATFISTSAIVGFGGAAGMFGLSLLWLTFLNIGVGIFVAFVFFGKRTRKISHKLGAHTFPEFLGLRYKSKFIQIFSGGVILTMVLYAAVVLIGAGRYLESTFEIKFEWALLIFTLIILSYVIAGGLKGVMYTDALQGTIMFIGMLVLLIITISKLGGFSTAHKDLDKLFDKATSKQHLQTHMIKIAKSENITLDNNQSMTLAKKFMGILGLKKKIKDPAKLKAAVGQKIKNLSVEGIEAPQGYGGIFKKSKLYVLQYFVLNGLKKLGHRGWTRMPKAGKPFWWLIVSTIIMGVGIGVLAQPQLSVRFMTVKSNRELNRSVLVGGVFILLMTGVAFVVGALSNGFFFKTNNGLVSFISAGLNTDKIIPTFLKKAVPQWFNYVFMLTLLAAAMSTLSSQFHAMGTAISRDIFETAGIIKKDEAGGKKSIFAAKIGVGVMILITLILGAILPKGYIAAGTALFFGLCASSFLPSLIGALYWKRATKKGAIASIVTGFSVSLFWLLLVHVFTVKKLGWMSIFGKSAWGLVDPLFIALPISAIVFVVVSLTSEKLDDKHVENCLSD